MVVHWTIFLYLGQLFCHTLSSPPASQLLSHTASMCLSSWVLGQMSISWWGTSVSCHNSLHVLYCHGNRWSGDCKWPYDAVVEWNTEYFKGEGLQNVAVPCDSSQECFYVCYLWMFVYLFVCLFVCLFICLLACLFSLLSFGLSSCYSILSYMSTHGCW